MEAAERADTLVAARLWLSRYAPGYYSPEMTDADVEGSVMVVADLLRPVFNKLISCLNENIPR